MNLDIIKYSDDWQEKWDYFVLHESMNGTFLQSRRFLNYHQKNRFIDASLIVVQGTNMIAVVPACEIIEGGKKILYSHKGSTFGGIIFRRDKYNVTTLEQTFPLLESYLQSEGYQSVFIKPTSDIFSKENDDLLDYYFYKNNYKIINELSFYVDLDENRDFLKEWSSGKRRDFRIASRKGLIFRALETEKEYQKFYQLLESRLQVHGVAPIHTMKELKLLRDVYIPEQVKFYGVFCGDALIAGTMLFYFDNIIHTQYLAYDEAYNEFYPMSYLLYHVFDMAKAGGFKGTSFGISTEEQGKKLNVGLAVFKEGFGAKYCNNRSYQKELSVGNNTQETET